MHFVFLFLPNWFPSLFLIRQPAGLLTVHMSKVFDFGGDTDFYPSGFLYPKRNESSLFSSLGHHVDVYLPRKRSRVSAPFVFVCEQKQKPSMEVLPDECLFEVFKRLSGGQERSACACVSKRWLMLVSGIHRDEILPAKTTDDSTGLKISSVSQKFDSPTMPKEKVEIMYADICEVEDIEELLTTESDGFLSRCLEGKKATDVRLASIAVGTGYHGGLGKLSIRGSSFTQHLTNLGLKAIANGCPSLRDLSLWNLPSITDEGICAIATGARLLENFDLSHCPAITDKALTAIAMNCTNLMSVTLESCAKIGNESLKALASYCPNLKFVTVKNLPLIGDQGITSLFTSAGHILTKAKFQAIGITDVSLAVIGHYGLALTDLTFLDLKNVNDRGFWVMGKGQGLQKLKTLSIIQCRGLSDSGMESIGEGCPNLKLFALRNCLLVSDAGVVKFSKAAGALESFHLEECHRITQCGVFDVLANNHGKLKALALINCLAIRDLNFVIPMIPICHSLQSVVINSCPGFGDFGLDILGRLCPNLSQVDFSGLRGITNAGFLNLFQSLESGLGKINLNGCVNLTDDVVIAITKLHGATLELLNLDGCKNLTDMSLLAIASNCSILSDLDISSCEVTDSGIAMLAGADQFSLRVLSIAGCAFVSDKSLPFIEMLGKSLLGLNIQRCRGINRCTVDLLLEQLPKSDILF